MMFSRVILYIVLLLTAQVMSAQRSENLDNPAQKGVCHCGVFEEGSDSLTTPLIEKMPNIVMTKDEEGEKACKNLCISLAEANKKDAPKLLCAALKKDVKNLKVTIYSHLCGEKWLSTGKTSTVPICCHDGLPVECIEELFNQSQSKIVKKT
ncbi:uncharacterized protein LOC142326743 [Lycorma delicatula]|uniref:uncharacterized protein LOC142326743 n=1 Tax=Lycorma delicatula TaxID=130591 RepID=UPI003F511F87